MRKFMSGIAKLALTIAAGAILGGCAVGRSVSYADAPAAMGSLSSSGSVAVAVQDERPYVLSGGKPDRFVGLMRGGFGNPFDMNTKSGAPLADDLRDAIVRAMKARGINAMPVTVALREQSSAVKGKLLDAKARRSVLVSLKEWKSDTLMNTDFHYDVTTTVFDANGNQLASSTMRGMDSLGNLGLTPDDGVQKEVGRKIDRMFDDEKIIASLK